VSGGNISSPINKEFVTGSPVEAIVDADERITYAPLVVTGLYTNGKETLGTDNLDPYKLLRAIKTANPPLSVQIIDSPAGGAVGDLQYTSDATETFLSDITYPEGGAEDSAKIPFSFTVDSSEWVESTIT
jgi:hypothetical protein